MTHWTRKKLFLQANRDACPVAYLGKNATGRLQLAALAKNEVFAVSTSASRFTVILCKLLPPTMQPPVYSLIHSRRPAKERQVRVRPRGEEGRSRRKYPKLSHSSPAANGLPRSDMNGNVGREGVSVLIPESPLGSPHREASVVSSSIRDDYSTPLQSPTQNYREISAIPPSPILLSDQLNDNGTNGTDFIDASMNTNGEHKGRPPLLLQLNEAFAQRTDTSKPGFSDISRNELRRRSEIMQVNNSSTALTPASEDLILPPRGVADRLLATYLTREYVNLPLLHIPDFEARYADMWKTEASPNDPVFQGMVNAMFALGCLSVDPSAQSDGTMYFVRSRNLLHDGSATGESITNIQAYLVITQYLFATGNIDAAWKSIGIAIRISQSLHLHLKSGSHHLQRRVDRELAKRVWHSCIMLERMIAINFGKSSIKSPPSLATLPTPLETEYVDLIFGGEASNKGPALASDRPSIVEFFTASARLYERYSDVVAVEEELRLTATASSRKLLEAFDAQRLLDADRRLCNWNASLPPYLQSEASNLDHPIAQRQHNILRVRYLHMRVLLWRPLLAILASDPEICSPTLSDRALVDTPLIYMVASEAAAKCILAAREVADILIENERLDDSSHQVGPVPAWWENIGYLFTCATVMLAARLCPSTYDRLPPGTIDMGWNHCVDLMIEYRVFSPRVQRWLDVLQDIATVAMDMEEEYDSRKTKGDDKPALNQERDMTWLMCLPTDLE
ncbi:hypothetical protein LOZ58_002906 [Ophidiomyces ophidiicola]|nr:hypothetical protein LOZ65_004038 [Ophidiomyces ophidiicola]KAI1962564.1 hypothetical protein LOZ58_002906 [Ophidiomyces ophidiicola]